MGMPLLPEPARQGLVEEYFRTSARYWKRVYHEQDWQSLVYQARQAEVLKLVDKLALPAGSAALEVGCGAGTTAVELGLRGYRVEATDAERSMIDMTRRAALRKCVDQRVRTRLADVRHLPYRDQTFDLVLAVGVLPWLDPPAEALCEVARVMRRGAHLIITADNSRRLQRLLDPFGALRRLVGDIARAAGLLAKTAQVRFQSPAQVDRLLSTCGLRKIEGLTVGFGRVTALGFRVLPNRMEVWLHNVLQNAASRGVGVIRWCGDHYLVLSAKN